MTREAIDLKATQTKNFRNVITIYYLVNTTHELLRLFLLNSTEDELLIIWCNISFDIINTLNFCYLLWTFRPRKSWPEFYTLELTEMNRAGRLEGARPILDCHIGNKEVFDEEKIQTSI